MSSRGLDAARGPALRKEGPSGRALLPADTVVQGAHHLRSSTWQGRGQEAGVQSCVAQSCGQHMILMSRPRGLEGPLGSPRASPLSPAIRSVLPKQWAVGTTVGLSTPVQPQTGSRLHLRGAGSSPGAWRLWGEERDVAETASPPSCP